MTSYLQVLDSLVHGLLLSGLIGTMIIDDEGRVGEFFNFFCFSFSRIHTYEMYTVCSLSFLAHYRGL